MRLLLASALSALGAGMACFAQSPAEDSPAGPAQHPCVQIEPVAAPEVSIQACTDLIQTAPTKALLSFALTNRGIARRELGAFTQSVADLEAALALDPDPGIQRMLAWTYREMGESARAEALYTEILEADPHWQGWLSRCVVRQDLGKFEAALADCQAARAQDPDNEDVTYFTIRALNFLQDGRTALPLVRAAIERAPDDARLTAELVWALYYSGQKRRAVAKARAALLDSPDDQDLLLFLETAQP
ncbi:hypothetical protein AIOL_001971 [Candidatus Rhodobacter oscarellae]|uniref:TPR domain protein n=1 Tax=Candidatus Rhodobacter oscarellae TaxID=1675527 RepID=A0A0J9GTY8_9RHOB|nr:tetratricopeptide repeat protein [Candidatus Rhodobacter lobularis]KMW57013.1 hypothetical protein AIOL_001971 [Candidatus Rhodobacter lobularis]